MVSMLAVVLAAAATAAQATPTADPGCQAAWDAIFGALLGPSCQALNGTCPDACALAVDGVADACVGKYYANAAGQVMMFDPASEVAAYTILVGEGACRDELVARAVEDTANVACEGLATLLAAGSLFWCSDNASCSDACLTAVNATVARCSACETVTVQGSTQMAKTFLAGASALISAPCQAEVATCRFESGCTFDGNPAPADSATCPPTPAPAGNVVDQACQSAVAAAGAQVFLGNCAPVQGSDSCPDTCLPLFQNVLDVCAGKYFTNPLSLQVEPFEAGVLVGEFSALLPSECQAPVVDLVVSGEHYKATCMDGAAILESSFAGAFCNATEAYCPTVCQNILETVFTRCQVDTVVALGNASVPLGSILQFASASLSAPCNAATCSFGDGCDFPTTTAAGDAKGTTAADAASTTAGGQPGATTQPEEQETDAARAAAVPAMASLALLAVVAGL